MGERVARGERPRHEPAPEEPGGDGRGALGGPEVGEEEVRDGRADDQPAARRPSARRSRSASTRATFACIPVGSARAAVTTVTLIVDTEPGGRYGAIRAIVSGRAIANPTRNPARA